VFFPSLFPVSGVCSSHVKVDNSLTVRSLNFLLRNSLCTVSIRLIVVSTGSAVLVLRVAPHLVGSSALLLLYQINLILRRRSLRPV
jgi:hypothetical protein